jgi:hypothetical protein
MRTKLKYLRTVSRYDAFVSTLLDVQIFLPKLINRFTPKMAHHILSYYVYSYPKAGLPFKHSKMMTSTYYGMQTYC